MKTILVVDDEPDIVELLTNRLERSEFKVISTDNGRKAVETARQSHPDLILMDMLMPEMTGDQAIRELKKIPETKGIPIIVLTGLYDEDVARRNNAEGTNVDGVAYASVGKPFESAKLLAAIKKYI